MSSELVLLIDAWRDAHGQPSEASVSRAISPTKADNLVRAWRARGIKSMPDPVTLENLARFLALPLETVVLAAARDAGYLRPRSDGNADSAAPIAQ